MARAIFALKLWKIFEAGEEEEEEEMPLCMLLCLLRQHLFLQLLAAAFEGGEVLKESGSMVDLRLMTALQSLS